MQRGEEGVRQGLRVLVTDRRQVDKVDPAIGDWFAGCVAGSAVDRHPVPPLDEPCRQLLGERLEAAVARGNTPRAQDGNLQAGGPSQIVIGCVDHRAGV